MGARAWDYHGDCIVAWYICQYHTIVQYDLLPMHWICKPTFWGDPAFVETMFFSSMSFMEKWQRYPAVKRLGRVLEGWTQLVLAIRFWSSISIFGSGIYASVWERHTYYFLNEKWGAEYQSLCASRKGQIFQVWRKLVTKTCHTAYWKSLERIVDCQQACLFGIIARPASIQY